MVKAARKKTGISPIRALNQPVPVPVPVQVQEDSHPRPVSVTLRSRMLEVASIGDVWEIVDEWWRTDPIARRYYKVVLEDGTGITIFRDLLSGLWYEQRG